jgi:putative protease
MIEHIPEMIESGIDSLKIEGRMKGINYLASTVKVYRDAIDSCYAHPKDYRVRRGWIKELAGINNRGYCTGFYFGDPEQASPNYQKINPSNGRLFIGKVCETGAHGVNIEVRNKFYKGDLVEIFSREGPVMQDKIDAIFDEKGQLLSHAQPGSSVTINITTKCFPNDLIRKLMNS